MQLVYWPREFAPRTPLVDVAPRSSLSPPSLSGFRQAVTSPAAAWRVVYRGVAVHTSARILLWRALAAQIGGSSGTIVLPVPERPELLPWPGGVEGARTVTTLHSDSSAHGDGAGYAQPGIAVVMASAAARGGDQIEVVTGAGVSLTPGQRFSILDRCYSIASMVASAPGSATLRITPTLREAVVAGESLDFTTPTMLARLVDDRAMHMALEYGRYGSVDIEFTEDTSI